MDKYFGSAIQKHKLTFNLVKKATIYTFAELIKQT